MVIMFRVFTPFLSYPCTSRKRIEILVVGKKRNRTAAAAILLCVLLCLPPAVAAQQSRDSVLKAPSMTTDDSTVEGKKTESEDKKDIYLEEIVVTATRSEKTLSEVPAAVSVVTREDIENRNVQNVDSALNMVPGLFDKRAKPLDTTARVVLRGIPEQKRTLVMLDGQALNDGYTGAVNWNGLFPENVERIEVARGPFSSLYGGNAMGGVINIITRMPEKREFTLNAGYGSDNTYTTYASYGDRLFNRLSIFASYGYGSSDGYATDLVVKTPSTPGAGTPVTGAERTTDTQGNTAFLIGDRGDNSWWRDSAAFKLAYDFTEDSKAFFSFMRGNYDYDYGDPHTYLRDGKGKPVWSGSVIADRIDPSRLSLLESNFLTAGGARTQNNYNLGYETKLFQDTALKVTCGLIDNEDNWYITPSSSANRTGGPGKLNDTPSTAFQSDLQISMPVMEKHLLTFGAAYRYDKADTTEYDLTDWTDRHSKGDVTFESSGKDNIFSFYAQAEIALWRNITGYLGIRGDYWETYDGMVNQAGQEGFPQHYGSRNDFAASPKAALVYRPFEWTTLRGSVGSAFRPPNVYELYRTWVYYGTVYAANPSLDPERSVSWDLGLEQRFGENSTLRASYFENYLKDLIYRQDVTSTYKELINAGKAETRGVELEMEHRFGECFKVFGNFTYTLSEMIENSAKPSTEGKRLTGIPERMYSLGGEFTRGPLLITLTGRYADKQYNNDENLDVVSGVYGSYDSYFIADFFIRYRITGWSALVFAVDNLFDEKYYSYYRAPGRKFFGGVSLKF